MSVWSIGNELPTAMRLPQKEEEEECESNARCLSNLFNWFSTILSSTLSLSASVTDRTPHWQVLHKLQATRATEIYLECPLVLLTTCAPACLACCDCVAHVTAFRAFQSEFRPEMQMPRPHTLYSGAKPATVGTRQVENWFRIELLARCQWEISFRLANLATFNP